MDDVVHLADKYVFTPYVYPETLPEDDIYRQSVTLWILTTIGGYLLYFSVAGLSYEFLFDKRLMKHPKFLENQIAKEIWVTCTAIPVMTLMYVPFFLAEIRGHTLLFDDIDERSVAFNVWSVIAYIMWNDMLIYWIHRGLHHRWVYKYVHKTHHKWLISTPFASHAFTPLDGALQGSPYHLFVFVHPINKYVFLTCFVLVNVWTVYIHGSGIEMPPMLREIVNDEAHHEDHHLFFNYNHGQYFTLWDRIGGTYREPSRYKGKSPREELKLKGL
ncbi:Delta7-sterol 56-desaturase [Hondaea fermentalgiana]|uniref:Delta7-sterol 56-desaturase n=1 Tax=Hondaea fermentalgiana TaxID=2315210 RepID=A0A2R5GGM9_9STRA|nr:Delta7-sterol 56-desaturase [Hondaea fermentalgiana]|eukprot:GBG27014.1 Delta7-sterol 56-desaturase [Hondaea fermentalgiana]